MVDECKKNYKKYLHYVKYVYIIFFMKKYSKSNTSIFNIGYHLIWCPKYRRKVLIKNIALRLKELLEQKASQIGIEIEKMEIMLDHVHLFVRANPIVKV